MTTEPQPPLSESEKLAATLAALEAERQKRVAAGTFAQRPMLLAIPDGEALQVAQQRAIYAHLGDHPDAPKAIAAYDWMEIEFIGPKPTVETHPYGADHADAVDVTPYRPPVPPSPPPSPPSSARSLPPPKGQPDPRNYNIPGDLAAAERRRTQRFHSDDWGSSDSWPIRYPRGNRSGW